MKKISVIMGVYNAENTLKTCISSILDQTYKEWEFIICDDGSSDNSYKILLDYKDEYPDKFVILRNTVNCGLSKSLNLCLSQAKGDYIARMDADDISLPERLEKQVQFLTNSKQYDFVGCNVELFDENGVWGERVLPEKPCDQDLLWTAPFVHPTVLFRKSVLASVGAYRDIKKTLRCEDYDLWFRMFAAGKKGYNLQEKLFRYYEGKSSYIKRKYRYRINEARVRAEGYKKLGLMPKGIIYVIKPLVIGLIPSRILKVIKNNLLSKYA